VVRLFVTLNILFLTASSFAMDRLICLAQLKKQIENSEIPFQEPSGAEYIQTLNKFNGMTPSRESLKTSDAKTIYTVLIPSGKGQRPSSISSRRIKTEGHRSRLLEYSLKQQRQPNRYFDMKMTDSIFDESPLGWSVDSFTQQTDIDENCVPHTYRVEVIHRQVDKINMVTERSVFLGEENAKQILNKTYNTPVPTDLPLLNEFRTHGQSIKESMKYLSQFSGQDVYNLTDVDYEKPFYKNKLNSAKISFDNPFTKQTVSMSGVSVQVDYNGAKFDIKLITDSNFQFSVIAYPNASAWYLPASIWRKAEIPELNLNGQILMKVASDQDSEGQIQRIQTLSYGPLNYPNLKAYWPQIQWYYMQGQYLMDFTSYSSINYDLLNSEGSLPFNAQSNWLSGSEFVQVNSPLVLQVVEEVRKIAPNSSNRIQIAEAITQVLSERLNYNYNSIEVGGSVNEAKTDEIIRGHLGTCQNFSNLFTAVARSMGVPTRIVAGWSLKSITAEMHAWVEIEIQNGVWLPVEPQSKLHSFDSFNYIPLVFEQKDTYLDNNLWSQIPRVSAISILKTVEPKLK
jgi:transglutaminase-like putative cysteine protease